ncbi:putative flp pilus-assembly tadg-like n-terminal [Desulfoluna butyratoxydans]|uniref:Putative flp pilus-assembly tadg-like n-terminal n=2 Tax=Desulfoluna butyratoxydans TaxID=231438 RepID=A0A4U8YRR6_9BACT|nr:putative flp pilus-assembly tadg-like n-terminal [Desulfoluna butyratoxydans]
MFERTVHMEKKAITTSPPKKHEQGSIVLVVAFFMTALLMMLALVIESGYLFSEKRTLQNCVDAAAMAGALHLCDGAPEARARKVLVQNLFPGNEAVEDPAVDEDLPQNHEVEITRGYYDENDAYDDFLVYKEFAAEGDPDFPADEYVNAVKVSLTVRESLLMGELEKKKNVDVHVASVAFRRRFGILAHGESQISDIRSQDNFRRDQLIFRNMGSVHANGDVAFIKPVELTGNTLVTAGGKIINCRSGLQGARPVLDVRPIDWDYLRANGIVYTVDQWPEIDGDYDCKSEIPVEHGNTLYRHGLNNKTDYVFGLHRGDHNGQIYYFSAENADDEATLFLFSTCSDDDYDAYNFTVASELKIDFDAKGNALHFTMGGVGHDSAYIYCRKDIGSPEYGDSSRIFLDGYKGVVFRTEKNFSVKYVDTSWNGVSTHENFLNIIAQGQIVFRGHNSGIFSSEKNYINGTFGPPCNAALLMHGRLEMSHDKIH